MKCIIKKMNELPYEIQNIIYQYYYSFNIYKINNEIKDIFRIEYQVNNFIKRHNTSLIQKYILVYYKKYNEQIKEITYNRGKLLLCKYNKLKLAYSNLEYINNICYKINEKYKYIAPLIISNSGIYRYETLNRIIKFN